VRYTRTTVINWNVDFPLGTFKVVYGYFKGMGDISYIFHSRKEFVGPVSTTAHVAVRGVFGIQSGSLNLKKYGKRFFLAFAVVRTSDNQ
jgi:hypothetical protein